MAEYKLIQSDRVALLELRVNQAIAEGYMPYGQLSQMAGVHTQVVGKGISVGGGGGEQKDPPSLKIRHLTENAYTVVKGDRDYMLVFDVAGDVKLTLGAIDGATDSETFSVLAVNTLGRIDIVAAPGETLVAYAPHAEQSATIGLTRGSVKWYATGTNVPAEEA